MMEGLKRLLAPPVAPVEVPNADDITVFERAEVRLPADYWAFIRLYGSGSVDGFLWVFNRVSKNPHLNLKTQIDRQLTALRDLRERHAESLPYPFYPDPGGLLPVGLSDNGDLLMWRMRDVPDLWTVVVTESRLSLFEEYDSTLTEFLADIVGRHRASEVFPEDFPSLSPIFVPVES